MPHILLGFLMKPIFMKPIFDLMADFSLGAQIPCAQDRYTAFGIELKYPLVPLIHYIFIYLLLGQNHKQNTTPKSCILEVASFLSPSHLNA